MQKNNKTDHDAILEAKALVRYHLGLGNTLAKSVGLSLDGWTGAVESIVDEEDIDFVLPNVNNDVPREYCGSLYNLADHIFDFLAEDNKRLVLLENACLRPSDPYMLKHKGTLLEYGIEVYHLLTNNDLDTDVIEAALLAASSPFLSSGFLIAEATNLGTLNSRTPISEEQMQTLASTTCGVFVRAYDGDGKILWHRYKVEDAT